jgi:hypothetical protein
MDELIMCGLEAHDFDGICEDEDDEDEQQPRESQPQVQPRQPQPKEDLQNLPEGPDALHEPWFAATTHNAEWWAGRLEDRWAHQLDSLSKVAISTNSTCQWTRKRIVICSLSDRPWLFEKTFSRMKEYAELHGYHFEPRYSSLNPSRTMHWSKLLLLQELISGGGYDWYVWIDDDIYLTNLHTPLEEQLAPFPFKDMLLSRDSFTAGLNNFNSGMLVVKDTARVAYMLQRVWDIGEEIGCTHSQLWEQTAMQHYFDAEHAQEAKAGPEKAALFSFEGEPFTSVFVLVPQMILQSMYRIFGEGVSEKIWRPGHFSAHVCGMDKELRLSMLGEVIAQADAAVACAPPPPAPARPPAA